MAHRLFLVFLILTISSDFTVYGEKTLPAKNDSIVVQFNKYLGHIQLNQLVITTNFSNKGELNYSGSLGKVNLSNVNLLTIEPAEPFSDPLKFNEEWSHVCGLFNGKMTVAHLPPASLFILIKTRDAGLTSTLIYFDNGVKLNENSIGLKGKFTSALKITAVDPSFYDYIENAPYKKDTKKKLIDSTTLFFRKTNTGRINKNVNINHEEPCPGFVTFIAKDLKGWVTDGYYEEITVYLTISQQANQQANYIWYFVVGYSDRKAPPMEDDKYQDASPQYLAGIQSFSKELKKCLSSAINGTENK
jgi:hypothetical protein